MKKRTKTLLRGVAAAFLLLLILSTAFAGYLYRNPSRIKDVVARSLSQASGYDTRIQTLGWGHDPLRLRLHGVTVSSNGPDDGLHLAADSLGAEFGFEGDLGNRTLVIRRAGVQGVDLTLRGAALPETGDPAAGGPSWPARAGAWLVKRLLFADVRIEHAELTQGRVEVQSGAATLQVEGLEASFTSDPAFHASFNARLSHAEQGFLIDLPRVTAESFRPDDHGFVEGRITVHDGALERGDNRIPGVFLESALTLDPSQKRIRIGSLEVRLPDLNPLLPIALQPAPAARLEASGTVLLEEGRLEDGDFLIAFQERDSGLEIRGRMNATWSVPLRAAVEDLKCRFRPEDWIPLLPDVYKEPLAPLDLTGEVSITGGMEARQEKGRFHIAPDLTLAFSENSVSFASPPLAVTGVLTGRTRVHGAWPDPAISGTIRAREVGVEHPAFRLLPSKADLRLDGSLADIRLERAEIAVPEAFINAGEAPLSLQDVRVTMQDGRLEPFLPAFRLSNVRLEAEGLGPLMLEGELRNGRTILAARGEKIGILPFLSGEGRPLEDWSPTGDDVLYARAGRDASGGWTGSIHAGFSRLAFENDEAEAFGEGLSVSLDAEVRIDGNDGILLDSSTVEASAGELLVDRFYLNLKTHPVSVKARTRVRPDSMRLDDLTLDVVLGGVLSIHGSGDLENRPDGIRADLTVSAPAFPLEPAFRLFVKEPFRREAPTLEEAAFEGRGSADLRLRADAGGFFVSGDARIHEGTLRVTEPSVSLTGLSLSLPLRYGTLPDERPKDPLEGRLGIQEIRAPFLPEQSLSLNLEAFPNRIHASGPTGIAIPGGDLHLGPLDIEHGPEKGLSMETSLRLEDADLQPLLSRVWAKSPEGRIHGALTSIQYGQGRLTSQGMLQARVFDGRVTVENLGASGLLTAAPVFRLDAHWEGLNLEEMTSGTAFGRITGILRGRLKNFELAYGQPQRFDLLLETVPREGVEQRISVKAVDNIARIGGGGSPFAGLAGLFTSLFREFPYEKIGVHSVLETDVFRINGTIHEDGTEYLVKRSGISGVDVVNQNPDNRIRFKDMVKRIQRVTSTQGGPVIR
ncbi:MAG: hypothetical protein K9M82_01395 [Deltaproteobacteria bacterium]|nr:hypothetical protein [Deltaproteobacteria bacterium]